jgi:hypothetical protein
MQWCTKASVPLPSLPHSHKRAAALPLSSPHSHNRTTALNISISIFQEEEKRDEGARNASSFYGETQPSQKCSPPPSSRPLTSHWPEFHHWATPAARNVGEVKIQLWSGKNEAAKEEWPVATAQTMSVLFSITTCSVGFLITKAMHVHCYFIIWRLKISTDPSHSFLLVYSSGSLYFFNMGRTTRWVAL